MDKKYIGKTLEEIEIIFSRSAKKICKNWYTITVKNYCFGLLQKELYITCDVNGRVQDCYYRTDIK
ncbi:MAG: hypothetical protein P0Y62_06325 [Candidatus Chryseobacterium colombiense]|nr:hypothetical protein [Chryseobacterium sp.]WEK71169.1 MAG: hypothetical protein P0Y62_06325 [Chryseobacterium sp.]